MSLDHERNAEPARPVDHARGPRGGVANVEWIDLPVSSETDPLRQRGGHGRDPRYSTAKAGIAGRIVTQATPNRTKPTTARSFAETPPFRGIKKTDVVSTMLQRLSERRRDVRHAPFGLVPRHREEDVHSPVELTPSSTMNEIARGLIAPVASTIARSRTSAAHCCGRTIGVFHES